MENYSYILYNYFELEEIIDKKFNFLNECFHNDNINYHYYKKNKRFINISLILIKEDTKKQYLFTDFIQKLYSLKYKENKEKAQQLIKSNKFCYDIACYKIMPLIVNLYT